MSGSSRDVGRAFRVRWRGRCSKASAGSSAPVFGSRSVGLSGSPPRPLDRKHESVREAHISSLLSGSPGSSRDCRPHAPKCLRSTLVTLAASSERSRLRWNHVAAGTNPDRFLLSWPCLLVPFAVLLLRPLRARAPPTRIACLRVGISSPDSRSALVVSHHLDGFLRNRPAGLLRPATGPGVRRVVTRDGVHTLRRVPLVSSRTASLQPLPPRR